MLRRYARKRNYLNVLAFSIFFVLIQFTSWLNAYTNKTFLMHRPQGVNLAMESTTFYELKQVKKENLFGAKFQAIPFYSKSTDEADLGRYFGADGKNVISFKNQDAAGFVNMSYIVHDSRDVLSANPSPGEYLALAKLEPEQTTYGVMLSFCQDFERTIKGLSFKINMPVVQVENNMNIKITTEKESAHYKENILRDYFSGKLLQPAAGLGNSQIALTHAKIDDQDHEASGIADVDVMIGYKVFDKKKFMLCINAGVVIPTGNSPDGEWLFEPIYGNAGHWAVGGGAKFCGKLWECNKNEQSVKTTLCANYRYLLKEKEKRTLGIKLKNFEAGPPADPTFDVYIEGFSQYYTIAQAGDTYSTPAANVLTRDLYVEPKSQVDAIAALTYNYKNFTFDLGYNLFWKDQESVTVKHWEETKYGIPAKDWDGSAALDGDAADNWAANKKIDEGAAINKADLDINAARTPSYLTHKIFAGVGYIARDMKCPLMAGLGGSYEFASNNHEIENWSVWGKVGVAF